MVLDPWLAQHLAHWGINMMQASTQRRQLPVPLLPLLSLPRCCCCCCSALPEHCLWC